MRTAMSVGQASGLALVAAAVRGIPVAQYSPNEVKLAVTGDGRADKLAVQTMVARCAAICAEIPKPRRRGRRARPPPACCHSRSGSRRMTGESGSAVHDRLGARHGARTHV